MKKPSVISFLTTLLLAATICTHGQEPVKDSAGNSLKTGQQYFIQPVSNKGGGLVPAAISLRICPLGIVQSLLPSQPGLPVSFKFLSSVTDSIVTISTNVTIEFKSDSWLFCDKFPKFWEVDESSPSANKEPTILIGGKPEQSNSQFKIEKAGERAGANTYKLTSLTGTVGAIPGIWGIQLVLTNDTAKTLLVEFSKFNIATTSTSRVEKLGLRMFPFY